jgi:hypothetical protein
MNPPNVILDLIERFQRNALDLRSNRYNETELRREFLDPFFEALGWDVNNRLGYSETYKDVVHEPTRETEQGIPDYCFRVGGTPKFYVEAKKPSVRLKDNPDPALQLRRYAWSSKLPLSILSNFDELAIYDCRTAPKQGDKASAGRISYYTFEEYPQKWEEIASRFSKEAVLQGSFDRFAISSKAKRGTTEVDAAFLTDIEEWRHSLAAGIAVRNPGLGQREVNFAVQRTIDRIIFLRICEDRGLESYGQLRALTERPGIYPQLCNLFQLADKRYNSGLFHFHQEKERNESPDTLTPTITVEDARLKPILKKLYYPESPYAFSNVPADILGQVYEQFLGKVIRITPARQVKVEAKPEVLKAGGVYYTPTYIVDYIVKNTVGKLLEGKSPKQITKIRILDPACGSGSFLIGAYQYLLNWYRDRYMEEGAQKHRNEIVPDAVGNWRLTLNEKKNILTRHIFGVDIDSQAVEVTKLSLLLKVLEAETQLKLFHERALPDLGDNIKWGNSIIDFTSPQLRLLGEEDRIRINPFNWKTDGFPEIINDGGFDAVIGNPPYRRELNFKHLMDEIAETPFGAKYRSPRMDLWYYFVHRTLDSLLKKKATLSFIVNAYWVAGTGAEKLIRQLRTSAHINEIFFLDSLKVFQNVSGSHMLLQLANAVNGDPTVVKRVPTNAKGDAEPFVTGKSKILEYKKTAAQLFRNEKIDLEEPVDELLRKLESGIPLTDLGIVRQGIAENPPCVTKKANKAFGERWKVGDGVFALQKEELAAIAPPSTERALIKPYYDLCDLGRYRISEKPSLNLIYSTRHTWPEVNDFPRLKAHLAQFRPIMERRRETRTGNIGWWQLHWPRDERLWTSKKIVSVQMAVRPSFVLTTGEVFTPFSTNVFLKDPRTREDDAYIVALLNSKALWKWFQHNAKRRGGLEINGNVLGRTPIHVIDFSNAAETSTYGELCNLVSFMQSSTQRVALLRTEHERTALQRQIEATDRQIDKLVYELYGLTEDEIAIVESSVKG